MTMKRILLLFLLFCGGYVHAQELDSARIHYRQGHREVDMLFRDNRAELERFIRTLREEHGADRLESVVIRSWASPEGVNRLNGVLSERRADSLKSYLVRHAGIPDSLICIHGEGIAWDMLRQMVAASDILYKEEVLHILDHTPVWVFDKAGRVVDGRKKQLMDLRGGMPYTYMLENFFPELRSSLSVACYRKPEPPVKVISQKETKVKEPEPALQPDSVAVPPPVTAAVARLRAVPPTGATWQHKVTIIIHNNLDNGIQVIKKHRNKFQADSAFRYRVPLPVRAGIRVQRGRELPFRRKAAREDLRPGRGQVADAGALAGFEPEPPRGGARTYPAFSRVVLHPLARPCGHREQHQPRAVPGR